MTEVRGAVNGTTRCVALAAASFNEVVVSRLVDGALACLRANGVSEDAVTVVWAPGAFELPLLARRLASSGRYDAVVCVGAVIRGETQHFHFVAQAAASGVQDAAAATGVPITFGVLTTDTMQQALDRAGGSHGNKGWEAAAAALQMASALDRLPGPGREGA